MAHVTLTGLDPNGRSAGTGGSSRKHKYPWCLVKSHRAVLGDTQCEWYIYTYAFGEFIFGKLR